MNKQLPIMQWQMESNFNYLSVIEMHVNIYIHIQIYISPLHNFVSLSMIFIRTLPFQIGFRFFILSLNALLHKFDVTSECTFLYCPL